MPLMCMFACPLRAQFLQGDTIVVNDTIVALDDITVTAQKNVIHYVVHEFERVYKAKDENLEYEKELRDKLAKLQKTRQRYMDMYADDLISREELNEKIGGMKKEIDHLENELKMVSCHLTTSDQLESLLQQTFKEIENITDVRQMTNAQLKRIVQRIEVDKHGNVEIYLKLLNDLGLDETVDIHDNSTHGCAVRFLCLLRR